MYDKVEEYLKLYDKSLEELIKTASEITSKNFGNKVDFCSLISAKTGKCSQDCKYCAQSSHYRTNIETHPLVSIEDVKKAAKDAKNSGVSHFSIVTSGRLPANEEFKTLTEMIKVIEEEGLKSCASLGIVTKEQMQALKNAGLKRFHHNINTCKSYHSEICTTHSYQDRIDTINLAKELGIEVCCGAIIGMGESRRHRIELALELANIKPVSVPINFLYPIEGTPFEGYLDKINEEEILKTLAIFRIIMPNISIRYAGGREIRVSKEGQKAGIVAAIDGMLVGNLLTTIGSTPQEDLEMLEQCNKELKK